MKPQIPQDPSLLGRGTPQKKTCVNLWNLWFLSNTNGNCTSTYNQTSATGVLKYVAGIFARGDAKSED